MSEIYRNARRVLVWLGDDSGLADRIFGLVERTFKQITEAGGGFSSSPPKSIHDWTRSRLTPEDINALDSQDWKFLDAVFSDEYFRRVWVMQEIGIASKAKILFGGEEVEWLTLVTVATFLNQEGYPIRARWALRPFRMMQMFRLFHDDFMQDRSFIWLMHRCRQMRCSDRKDRIYALLAHPYARAIGPFEVNYASSTSITYQAFALDWISKTRCVNILSLGGYRMPGSSFPSWAPYLQSHNYTVLSLNESDFSASGSFPARVSSISAGILSVYGLTIDHISARTATLCPKDFLYTPYAPVRPANSPTGITALWQECVTWPLVSEYTHLPSRFHAFLLTLLPWRTAEEKIVLRHGVSYWKQAKGEGPSSEAIVTDYDNALQDALNGLYDPKVGWVWYMKNVKVVSKGRQMFYTTGGRLGLGPADMEDGDLVSVLFGGELPYILRPAGQPGQYKLVGECYIPNLVHGEAIGVWQSGGLQEVEYHII